MRNVKTTLVIAALAASQLGATDCGQAIRDPGFDLWCGDSLCAWTVERGAVAKVPTWNAGDPGVALVGEDVAIAQLSPVASSDGTCLEFDLIADVDQNAELDLNIDVYADGSIDSTERIPTARWQKLTYQLFIPGTWNGVRFELAKRGAGKAVVAQIEAKEAPGACTGLPPIVPAPGPLGGACVIGSNCASGRCGGSPGFLGQCTGCVAAGCTTGQVCGLGAPVSPVDLVPLECVAAGARQLGEQCLADGECANNTCNNGFCSTCKGGCNNGETCMPAWPTPADWASFTAYPTAYECAPHAHHRATGEPCINDDDCASSSCNGTPRSQCEDGRTCASAADCPFGGAEASDNLQQSSCTRVGVQGGTCR